MDKNEVPKDLVFLSEWFPYETQEQKDAGLLYLSEWQNIILRKNPDMILVDSLITERKNIFGSYQHVTGINTIGIKLALAYKDLSKEESLQ